MITDEMIKQKADEYAPQYCKEAFSNGFTEGANWMQEQSMRWVDSRNKIPPPNTVVATKMLFEDNGPRQDWELHWAFVNKDGRWVGYSHAKIIHWLYEPQLSSNP